MGVIVCDHCGADLTRHPAAMGEGSWLERCFECGLASDDGGPWHRPFDGDVESRYRLDDWPPAERVALTNALYDVAFRWEPGPRLVVRHADAAVVEAFLEDCQFASHALDEEPDDQLTGDGVSMMHDLFVASDRLARAPWDTSLIARIAHLAGAVATSPPPYGVDESMWDELARNAAEVAATSDLDDETVSGAARRLRWLLRDYV